MSNPLLEAYNELPQETKNNLGKVSSIINKPGVHSVKVKDMRVEDGKFLKIDFEDALGQTATYVGFLKANDKEKQESTTARVMNQLTAICNAAGVERNKVLANTVEDSITYGDKTVQAVRYPSIVGKNLYITTYTEIQADSKNAEKAWKVQVVDTFKFFDTRKRNALEIAENAEVGKTLEQVDEEAKSRVEIKYSDQNNKACKALLAILKNTSGSSAAADTEEVDEDDI